ncbi:MAG: hypothetical protein EA352_12345, partial [Gemmatimonadales bacterium]
MNPSTDRRPSCRVQSGSSSSRKNPLTRPLRTPKEMGPRRPVNRARAVPSRPSGRIRPGSRVPPNLSSRSTRTFRRRAPESSSSTN